MPPVAKTTAAAKRRAAVVAYARELVGIHEVPAHSNNGPVQQHAAGVHVIQSATGAYYAPWCVSTVQYIWRHVLGSTWANKTAGVYYLIEYARAHGAVIPHPLVGCAVCYVIGAGHAGTVVKVYRDGTFDAIEGNHSDKVALVRRDPKHLHCVFILRPELRG
jgi:hypothetical protein